MQRRTPFPLSGGTDGGQQSPTRDGVRPEVARLAVFVVLACLHTWPLAQAPGTWCRNDSADPILNEWTLAWVAHQIVADPIHLFDANIFHPERYTLAYSEHMLPQALMVAPVHWLGGSPVLAHNLALLAGLALTGWAFCFMVRRWTGSLAAGLVAGSAAAFNAHTLTRLAHVQAQHLEFLALAMLTFDRLLAQPRVRRALALAGWFALQALTSGYAFVFTVLTLAGAAAARAADWLRPRHRAPALHLALAGLVAVGLMLPFLAPYWLARSEVGLGRTLDDLRMFSATPSDYLASGGLLHWRLWSARFFRADALFPGLAVLALSGLTVWWRVAWTDRRARMWLVVAVVAAACSFGVRFPPYVWLYKWVPLFQGIRAPVRYGHVVLLALAVLAAFGAAALLARVPAGRRRMLAGLALVVMVNAEAWRGPLEFTAFTGIPRIYRTLAGIDDAVVAYFPLYAAGERGRNTRYMLGSTLNWRPMINGYSGFTPPSFRAHVAALRGFPDDASIAYLRQVGVTHVGIDSRHVSESRMAKIAGLPDLRPFATDGNFHVYALR